jgi:hypothetical protein
MKILGTTISIDAKTYMPEMIVTIKMPISIIKTPTEDQSRVVGEALLKAWEEYELECNNETR